MNGTIKSGVAIALFILGVTSMSGGHNSKLLPYPNLPLQLGSQLHVDAKAETLLKNVTDAMQEVTPQDGSIPRPGWKKLETFEQLARVVKQYPATESALTAKLLIGCIYADTDNDRRDVEKALKILLEVQENFPATWQAVIAEITQASLLCVESQWNAAIPHLRHGIEKIELLEKAPKENYLRFRKVVYPGLARDPRPDLLEALMHCYCMSGDLDSATAICKRLIQEFDGHPQAEFANRAFKKLAKGLSPYAIPPQKAKQQISEEIRKVDKE